MTDRPSDRAIAQAFWSVEHSALIPGPEGQDYANGWAECAQTILKRARAIDAAQPAGEAVADRDREADRLRFPDATFNDWLDCGISDCGHTVYDSIGSIADAWQGWNAHLVATMLECDEDALVSVASQEDGWRCEQCGDMVDAMSPAWRWAGDRWQHHHEQVGHVDARNFASQPVEGAVPDWFIARLEAFADAKYVRGISVAREDACLGWEHKAKTGKYGEAEHAAHERLNRAMGAHFGIHEAIRTALASAPPPPATINPRESDRKLIGEGEARDALIIAEAALADIGDADREPGDDVAWCERRAAQALPKVRAAIDAMRGGED